MEEHDLLMQLLESQRLILAELRIIAEIMHVEYRWSGSLEDLRNDALETIDCIKKA